MPKRPADPGVSAYYKGFRTRLKSVRADLGWSQTAMADALGIPMENYRKYETRDKFPLHLIPRLALVTHLSVDYWLDVRVRHLRPVSRGN